MRILHTSDWHLGRSFGDFRLLADQRSFLTWLVERCVAERVELVAVAGDLFDRSVPPADAVALLRDVLREFQSAGIEVVAIAGNHDSAERLAAYDGLTEAAGLVIRGGYERASLVDVRTYSDGPLAIAAVPFLDPVLAPPGYVEAQDEGGRLLRYSHDAVLRSCLDDVRDSMAGQPRSLVLAHAFVAGGAATDSERELAIGGTSAVGADAFSGFSYSALGHLHRPQVIDGRDNVRYSGSPLAYSFSERKDTKQVTLVEMEPDGAAKTTSIPIPEGIGRRARRVVGAFDEVMAHAGFEDDPFVRVELTNQTRVIDAHRRLREKFPFLAEIAYTGEAPGQPASAPTAAKLREQTPLQQVQAFWAANATDELAPDQEAIVIEVLEKLGRAEAAR